MCLGVPAIVVEVDEGGLIVKVDYGDGILREALVGISEDRVSRGDIVIVHAGVIVSKLSEEGLLEHVRLLSEVLGEGAVEAFKVYERLLELARALRGLSVPRKGS